MSVALSHDQEALFVSSDYEFGVFHKESLGNVTYIQGFRNLSQGSGIDGIYSIMYQVTDSQ